MRLRVIGIGSPHGDDAVGLAVADRLAREGLAPDVDVLARSCPGIDLIDDLDGVDGVILVDALRGGSAPGGVHRVDPARIAPGRGASSHALGVAEALALAAALGRTPLRLRMIGIEAQTAAGSALSPAVGAAVPRACLRVRAEIGRLRRAPPDP